MFTCDVCVWTVESLSRYLLDALSLAEDTTQILEEVSFEGVAKYITSGKCQNIITMVGAGISTCKSWLSKNLRALVF